MMATILNDLNMLADIAKALKLPEARSIQSIRLDFDLDSVPFVTVDYIPNQKELLEVLGVLERCKFLEVPPVREAPDPPDPDNVEPEVP